MSLSPNSGIPNLEKVGNLIIYLVDGIKKKYRQETYLTKLLKLLYIIDETSVRETGVPVTGLDYSVWKMGPVPYFVYKDLMHDNSNLLSFFAEAKKGEKGDWALIKSVNTFDDSEFSDYEITLMDRVINDYGYLQKDRLIELLHEEGSLWKNLVDQYKLEDAFKKENTSHYKIDLSKVIEHDPLKLSIFNDANDSLKL